MTFLKLNGIKTSIGLTMPVYGALIEVAEHKLNREGLAGLLRNLLS